MNPSVRRVLLGLCISVPAVMVGCVGDSSSTEPDGSTGPDGSMNDATVGNDVLACNPGCVDDASTLRMCDSGAPMDTTCALGCLTTGSPHCGVFNPTGLVEPGDFTTMLVK